MSIGAGGIAYRGPFYRFSPNLKRNIRFDEDNDLCSALSSMLVELNKLDSNERKKVDNKIDHS